MKYKQDFYTPTNKEKYIGDINNIVYRSNLELSFFNHFDKKKEIIAWGSEEITIPYFSEVDNRTHSYFPDIIIKYKNKKNELKKAIIEIKCTKEISETLYYLSKKKGINKKIIKFFIDNILKIKNSNELQIILKEFKAPKKITKKYKEYLKGVLKNIDKWIYAYDFCKKRGIEFYIMSEKDLK